MIRIFFATIFCISFLAPVFAEEELTCFELRTYYTNEGQLDALHARFRDHTVTLFEKHGMTNFIYWEPVENEEQILVYLLGYPDMAARDASWKAFRNDPVWKKAYADSTEGGKLVRKVDSVFLELTDYSPVATFPATSAAPTYELRRYTTSEGKLDGLDARSDCSRNTELPTFPTSISRTVRKEARTLCSISSPPRQSSRETLRLKHSEETQPGKQHAMPLKKMESSL